MSPVEWIATALGVACVVLVVRRSVWNYPLAIGSVGLFAIVFFDTRLYSDALLQLFFIAINLYGWVQWTRVRAATGEVIVELMSPAARLRWSGWTLLAWVIWSAAMHRFTDAALPWWDAAVAIPSIVAQLLQARRKLECWWLWIAVDVLAIPLYLSKGLVAAAGLYVIYLGLSVWGLVDWRRALRTTGPVVA